MIKIGTNSQSIEHHHHHIHHLGNGACVDNTPFMTPAQSVENFYNVNEDMLVEDLDTADEALSVAGTEYSEAPSVARSYTISQHSNQVGYLSFFFYQGRRKMGVLRGPIVPPIFGSYRVKTLLFQFPQQ